MTYIALLRAVNVGNTWIKMAELGEMLSAIGLQNITTYIQSGNIVFTSGATRAHCRSAIANALEKRLNAPVGVILKSRNELKTVVAANPFLESSTIDKTKLHVTFLSEVPMRQGLAKLGRIEAGADQFRASGSVIYVYCPGGYGRTKLSNSAIERALAIPATTRNWNTVNTLLAMATTV